MLLFAKGMALRFHEALAQNSGWLRETAEMKKSMMKEAVAYPGFFKHGASP